MKKYLSILVIIMAIIPSVALASWWDPFSWSIFHRTDTKTQTSRIQNATTTKFISPTIVAVTSTTTDVNIKKSNAVKKKTLSAAEIYGWEKGHKYIYDGIVKKIYKNPTLTCEQLGYTPDIYLQVCREYKETSPDELTSWTVISEAYSILDGKPIMLNGKPLFPQVIETKKSQQSNISTDKGETKLVEELASITSKYKFDINNRKEDLLSCVKRESSLATEKYDAKIQSYKKEIDEWKWHLANLCDRASDCPVGRYSARNIDYLDTKISLLEESIVFNMGYKLDAIAEAMPACGLYNYTPAKPASTAISEYLSQKSLQYKSVSNPESYTIRPNSFGGYDIQDSHFQTWTVAPNNMGGYEIRDPNFNTSQVRPNGMGGYEVSPY